MSLNINLWARAFTLSLLACAGAGRPDSLGAGDLGPLLVFTSVGARE